MYDPHVGRWTTTDPIGFEAGDADLYRYVGNDPANFVDPSGLVPIGKCFPTMPSAITPSKATAEDAKVPAEAWFVTYYVPELCLRHAVVAVEYEGKIHTFSYDTGWNYDDPADLAAARDPNSRPEKTFKTNKAAVLNEYWKRVAEDTSHYNFPFYTCYTAAHVFLTHLTGKEYTQDFFGKDDTKFRSSSKFE